MATIIRSGITSTITPGHIPRWRCTRETATGFVITADAGVSVPAGEQVVLRPAMWADVVRKARVQSAGQDVAVTFDDVVGKTPFLRPQDPPFRAHETGLGWDPFLDHNEWNDLRTAESLAAEQALFDAIYARWAERFFQGVETYYVKSYEGPAFELRPGGCASTHGFRFPITRDDTRRVRWQRARQPLPIEERIVGALALSVSDPSVTIVPEGNALKLSLGGATSELSFAVIVSGVQGYTGRPAGQLERFVQLIKSGLRAAVTGSITSV